MNSVIEHYKNIYLNQKSASIIEAIKDKKKKSLEALSSKGFPSRKDEDWKYLKLGNITEKTYEAPSTIAAGAIPEMSPFESKYTNHLIFIDGRFHAPLSYNPDITSGVEIIPFNKANAEQSKIIDRYFSTLFQNKSDGFVHLNTLLCSESTLILVKKNSQNTMPLHLLYLSTIQSKDKISLPRNLIVIEEDAKADLIEEYVDLSDSNTFINSVNEIILEKKSTLHHIQIRDESGFGSFLNSTEVRVGVEAKYDSFVVNLGANTSRFHLHVDLAGVKAQTECLGLFLGHRDYQLDHHVRIDHTHPQTQSHIVYKGIADHQSKLIYNGKVVIHPNAPGCSTAQKNNNLLLSNDAEINPKPELQIDNDDVKASHGATVGDIDQNALFYLLSRGLDEHQAETMLTYAFAYEVIDRVENKSIRKKITTLLSSHLGFNLYEV